MLIFSGLLLEEEEGSGWYEPWRISFHHHLPRESTVAKLLFRIIPSLITIVFATSWPEAKLADVIAVEKKLTGR